MVKLACLIDPEEENLQRKIKLGVNNADLFFIGGSTNPSEKNTDRVIEEILEENLNAKIWLFCGSPNDLPEKPAHKRIVERVLLPIPINATNYKFIFKMQMDYWDELKNDFDKKITVMAYYILHPTSSAGKKVQAFEPRGVSSNIDFIKKCGFKTLYLEGTGGSFSASRIKKVLEVWHSDNILKNFIYGGSIDSKKKLDKVREILKDKSGENIIVIGNKFNEVFKNGKKKDSRRDK